MSLLDEVRVRVRHIFVLFLHFPCTLTYADSVKVSLVFVKNNVGKNNDDNEHDSNSKNTDSNYTKLIKYILLKNKKPQFS